MNNFNGKNRAFSLIEILIVSAIIVILGSMGVGFYANYSKSVEINSLDQTIIFDLKQAQSKSMIGEGGLKYGIHFVNGTKDYYEIFSTPDTYLNKTVISTNYLTNGVTFSDPSEGISKDIIFNKISGGVSVASSVSLASQSNTKTIYVSSIGSITDVVNAGASTYCDGSGSTFTCGDSCIYNGDTYPTVLIGTQCWFAENLRTTLYSNGSSIAKGDSSANSISWSNNSTLYYSCPPNISNTGEDCASASDSNKLGLLYQWNTTVNGSSSVSTGVGPQGICPTGWQIPTDDNTVASGFGKLYNYVDSLPGCTGNTGSCLKIGGLANFNAPFAGSRLSNGSYVNRGTWFNFWSSSESNSTTSWNRRLYYTNSPLDRNNDLKPIGFSVRCLHN